MRGLSALIFSLFSPLCQICANPPFALRRIFNALLLQNICGLGVPFGVTNPAVLVVLPKYLRFKCYLSLRFWRY